MNGFADLSVGKVSHVNMNGFKDEDKTWTNKHDRKGLLTMANNGPDTNKATFMITLAPLP